MNDHSSCLAIDENESQSVSEMDKDLAYEESSMRPQTSYFFDEVDFVEDVQNQLMLASEFKNQGIVDLTPAWEKPNSIYGSQYSEQEQKQYKQSDDRKQQDQQYSFDNNGKQHYYSQSEGQFKQPSGLSTNGYPQNQEKSSNNLNISANPFNTINSNTASYGNNNCDYEGGYSNPSNSAYQSSYPQTTYGDFQSSYGEQERSIGGYENNKKALYGHANKYAPVLYGGDNNNSNEWTNNNNYNNNTNNSNTYSHQYLNQQQLPFRGGKFESVFNFDDDDDELYTDQHFKRTGEMLRKIEIQSLSLYKNHNLVTKKQLVNIVLIDKQSQTIYGFDQQEIELTEDKTFNVNDVIQLDLIQTYIQSDFIFFIAQEGDISEIYLGTHPVWDEKKIFQRVSKQGQITLLFQRPIKNEKSTNNPSQPNLRFHQNMFIQSEGIITTNLEPDQSKDKRVQERSVREALQLVKQWRCTYEETKRRTKPGYHIISLEKVADIAIKCKKKTLDYYFLELRKAEVYGYDFSTNLDAKMSNVRSFNASQKDKYPAPINPPNDLAYNLSEEYTLKVNEEDVLKLLETSRPNKKTQVQTNNNNNLGIRRPNEPSNSSRHGSFSQPETSNVTARQQGMQNDQTVPRIQKGIKKVNNQNPQSVGGYIGSRGLNSQFRLLADRTEMVNCMNSNESQNNRNENQNNRNENQNNRIEYDHGNNGIRDNQENGMQMNTLGEIKMEMIPESNQQQGQQQDIQQENDIPVGLVELKAQESIPFNPSLEYGYD